MYKKRYKITRLIILTITFLIGISALFGSICMFIDSSGNILKMNELIPYFRVLPLSDILFKNYIFSGISLLIVNGLTNILAFYLIIKDKEIGYKLSSIFGVTLMLWIIIQFIILPTNVLSISFFIIGFIEFIVGYIAYVSYLQINFKFNINEYKNINKNKDNLIIYFSRTGYTKKLAYEYADKLGAYLLEIKTKEKINGTLGFWWCGRFGMNKMPMEIDYDNVNLNDYKNIIIFSPIWVFDISSPIKMFCIKNSKKIKNVEYVFTHYMKNDFKNVADNLDKLLNTKRKSLTSICVRMGKIIYIKNRG